jgi:hypothetical protein
MDPFCQSSPAASPFIWAERSRFEINQHLKRKTVSPPRHCGDRCPSVPVDSHHCNKECTTSILMVVPWEETGKVFRIQGIWMLGTRFWVDQRGRARIEIVTLFYVPEEAMLLITYTNALSRRSYIINHSHRYTFQKKRYCKSLTLLYVPKEAIVLITHSASLSRRSDIINHSHCLTSQKKKCC